MNDEMRQKILQEMLDALDTAAQPERPEGEGWFTIAELAAAKDRPIDTIRDQVAKLVARGVWEKSGRYGQTKYYRMVKRTD